MTPAKQQLARQVLSYLTIVPRADLAMMQQDCGWDRADLRDVLVDLDDGGQLIFCNGWYCLSEAYRSGRAPFGFRGEGAA